MSSSKFDEMMGKIKNYNGGGYFVFDKSNRVNDPPSYSGQKSNNGAAGYYNGGGNGVPASAVAGTNYQESSNAPQFSSSYKDKWATVLFVVHFFVFIGISAAGWNNFVAQGNEWSKSQTVNLNNTDSSNSSTTGNVATAPQVNLNMFTSAAITGPIVSTIFAMFGVGFLVTMAYFYMMQRMARRMIQVSLIAQIVLSAVAAVLSLITGATPASIFAFIYVALIAFCYWSWRRRIPFSAVLLETVTQIIMRFPGALGASVIALIIHAVWVIIWAVMSAGAVFLFYNFFEGTSTGNTAAGLVGAFLTFSFVWTSLIITNVVHVAVCGLFGLVFFQGDVSSGQIVVPVRNPTAASARRALTSSFGSVAFGSLIVALVDTLKQALQARANDQQLGFAGQLAAACCACIVNWFEQMLELFNQYAYAHVAIYGKPFCEAARDTWSMIKSKGVTLIINDQLIHSVLAMGAFLVGIICGGVSYSIFLATTINQPDLQGLGVLVFFVGLLIGCVQFHVVCQTVKSGVVSTFVCLAQDAESVKRIKPELYQLMQELYPTIPVFMVVPSAAGFSTIPANPYARYQPPQPQAGMQRW